MNCYIPKTGLDMKVIAITQARIGSSRFPEKILKEINGKSLLEIHLSRILKSRMIGKLLVATTFEPGVEKIIAICDSLGVGSHKGSLNDVLERFYETALPENPDWVVRLTSDCPLIDAAVIDEIINYAISKGYDYVSNTISPTYPDGLDVEVFRFSALERAMKEANLSSDREHVTPYIWRNSSYKSGILFSSDSYMREPDLSAIRLTVDTAEDFELIQNLILELGTERPWLEYVKLLNTNSELLNINSQYIRNEGYQKSISNDNKN